MRKPIFSRKPARPCLACYRPITRAEAEASGYCAACTASGGAEFHRTHRPPVTAEPAEQVPR
jgi:hypothetical protein